MENKRQALKRWKAHLGNVRVDRIEDSDIASFRDKRLRDGAHARTVNLDLIALRNVLKAAVEDNYLREMPKAKTLKAPKPERRPLLTPEQFAALLAAICWPIKMDRGQSVGAILRAPYSKIAASACYPELPTSVVISTDHGDSRFAEGKVSRICDFSDGTNRKQSTAYASRQTFPKHIPGSMEREDDLRLV
ncbi:MAG: site-specific integrase [Chthoniobacteraceae bacterium]